MDKENVTRAGKYSRTGSIARRKKSVRSRPPPSASAGSKPKPPSTQNNAVAELINSIRTKPRFTKLVEFSVECLAQQCKNEETVDDMLVEGALEVIIDVARINPFNESLRNVVNKTLDAMCLSPALSMLVGANGGIEAALFSLRKHRDPETIKQTCTTLYKMLVGERNVGIFLKMNGVSALNTAADEFREYNEVVGKIAMVAGQCSTHVDFAAFEDLLDICLDVVKQYPENQGLADGALALLCRLVQINAEIAQTEHPDSIDVVMAAMEDHPDNESILANASNLIGIITTPRDIISSLKDMEPAQSILKCKDSELSTEANATTMAAVAHATSVMSNFLIAEGLIDILLEHDGLRLLHLVSETANRCKILRIFLPDAIKMGESAARALGRLCHQPQAVGVVINSGGFDVLLKFLENFAEVPQTNVEIVLAITQLVNTEERACIFLKTHGLDNVISATNTHPRADRLSRAVLGLVGTLASYPDSANMMAEAGIVEYVFIRLLRTAEQDSELFLNVLDTIAIVTSSSLSSAANFYDADGFKVLIALLESHIHNHTNVLHLLTVIEGLAKSSSTHRRHLKELGITGGIAAVTREHLNENDIRDVCEVISALVSSDVDVMDLMNAIQERLSTYSSEPEVFREKNSRQMVKNITKLTLSSQNEEHAELITKNLGVEMFKQSLVLFSQEKNVVIKNTGVSVSLMALSSLLPPDELLSFLPKELLADIVGATEAENAKVEYANLVLDLVNKAMAKDTDYTKQLIEKGLFQNVLRTGIKFGKQKEVVDKALAVLGHMNELAPEACQAALVTTDSAPVFFSGVLRNKHSDVNAIKATIAIIKSYSENPVTSTFLIDTGVVRSVNVACKQHPEDESLVQAGMSIVSAVSVEVMLADAIRDMEGYIASKMPERLSALAPTVSAIAGAVSRSEPAKRVFKKKNGTSLLQTVLHDAVESDVTTVVVGAVTSIEAVVGASPETLLEYIGSFSVFMAMLGAAVKDLKHESGHRYLETFLLLESPREFLKDEFIELVVQSGTLLHGCASLSLCALSKLCKLDTDKVLPGILREPALSLVKATLQTKNALLPCLQISSCLSGNDAGRNALLEYDVIKLICTPGFCESSSDLDSTFFLAISLFAKLESMSTFLVELATSGGVMNVVLPAMSSLSYNEEIQVNCVNILFKIASQSELRKHLFGESVRAQVGDALRRFPENKSLESKCGALLDLLAPTNNLELFFSMIESGFGDGMTMASLLETAKQLCFLLGNSDSFDDKRASALLCNILNLAEENSGGMSVVAVLHEIPTVCWNIENIKSLISGQGLKALLRYCATANTTDETPTQRCIDIMENCPESVLGPVMADELGESIALVASLTIKSQVAQIARLRLITRLASINPGSVGFVVATSGLMEQLPEYLQRNMNHIECFVVVLQACATLSSTPKFSKAILVDNNTVPLLKKAIRTYSEHPECVALCWELLRKNAQCPQGVLLLWAEDILSFVLSSTFSANSVAALNMIVMVTSLGLNRVDPLFEYGMGDFASQVAAGFPGDEAISLAIQSLLRIVDPSTNPTHLLQKISDLSVLLVETDSSAVDSIVSSLLKHITALSASARENPTLVQRLSGLDAVNILAHVVNAISVKAKPSAMRDDIAAYSYSVMRLVQPTGLSVLLSNEAISSIYTSIAENSVWTLEDASASVVLCDELLQDVGIRPLFKSGLHAPLLRLLKAYPAIMDFVIWTFGALALIHGEEISNAVNDLGLQSHFTGALKSTDLTVSKSALVILHEYVSAGYGVSGSIILPIKHVVLTQHEDKYVQEFGIDVIVSIGAGTTGSVGMLGDADLIPLILPALGSRLDDQRFVVRALDTLNKVAHWSQVSRGQLLELGFPQTLGLISRKYNSDSGVMNLVRALKEELHPGRNSSWWLEKLRVCIQNADIDEMVITLISVQLIARPDSVFSGECSKLAASALTIFLDDSSASKFEGMVLCLNLMTLSTDKHLVAGSLPEPTVESIILAVTKEKKLSEGVALAILPFVKGSQENRAKLFSLCFTILKQFSKSSAIEVAAIAALGRLCSSLVACHALGDDFLSKDGDKLLLERIKIEKDGSNLIECLKAARALSKSTSVSASLLSKGILALLVSVSTDFIAERDVQKELLPLLSHFVSSDASGDFFKQGGVALVRQLLTAHSSDVAITTLVLGLVENLSESSSPTTNLILLGANLPIEDIRDLHTSTFEIQRAVAAILQSLDPRKHLDWVANNLKECSARLVAGKAAPEFTQAVGIVAKLACDSDAMSKLSSLGCVEYCTSALDASKMIPPEAIEPTLIALEGLTGDSSLSKSLPVPILATLLSLPESSSESAFRRIGVVLDALTDHPETSSELAKLFPQSAARAVELSCRFSDNTALALKCMKVASLISSFSQAALAAANVAGLADLASSTLRDQVRDFEAVKCALTTVKALDSIAEETMGDVLDSVSSAMKFHSTDKEIQELSIQSIAPLLAVKSNVKYLGELQFPQAILSAIQVHDLDADASRTALESLNTMFNDSEAIRFEILKFPNASTAIHGTAERISYDDHSLLRSLEPDSNMQYLLAELMEFDVGSTTEIQGIVGKLQALDSMLQSDPSLRTTFEQSDGTAIVSEAVNKTVLLPPSDDRTLVIEASLGLFSAVETSSDVSVEAAYAILEYAGPSRASQAQLALKVFGGIVSNNAAIARKVVQMEGHKRVGEIARSGDAGVQKEAVRVLGTLSAYYQSTIEDMEYLVESLSSGDAELAGDSVLAIHTAISARQNDSVLPVLSSSTVINRLMSVVQRHDTSTAIQASSIHLLRRIAGDSDNETGALIASKANVDTFDRILTSPSANPELLSATVGLVDELSCNKAANEVFVHATLAESLDSALLSNPTDRVMREHAYRAKVRMAPPNEIDHLLEHVQILSAQVASEKDVELHAKAMLELVGTLEAITDTAQSSPENAREIKVKGGEAVLALAIADTAANSEARQATVEALDAVTQVDYVAMEPVFTLQSLDAVLSAASLESADVRLIKHSSRMLKEMSLNPRHRAECVQRVGKLVGVMVNPSGDKDVGADSAATLANLAALNPEAVAVTMQQVHGYEVVLNSLEARLSDSQATFDGLSALASLSVDTVGSREPLRKVKAADVARKAIVIHPHNPRVKAKAMEVIVNLAETDDEAEVEHLFEEGVVEVAVAQFMNPYANLNDLSSAARLVTQTFNNAHVREEVLNSQKLSVVAGGLRRYAELVDYNPQVEAALAFFSPYDQSREVIDDIDALCAALSNRTDPSKDKEHSAAMSKICNHIESILSRNGREALIKSDIIDSIEKLLASIVALEACDLRSTALARLFTVLNQLGEDLSASIVCTLVQWAQTHITGFAVKGVCQLVNSWVSTENSDIPAFLELNGHVLFWKVLNVHPYLRTFIESQVLDTEAALIRAGGASVANTLLDAGLGKHLTGLLVDSKKTKNAKGVIVYLSVLSELARSEYCREALSAMGIVLTIKSVMQWFPESELVQSHCLRCLTAFVSEDELTDAIVLSKITCDIKGGFILSVVQNAPLDFEVLPTDAFNLLEAITDSEVGRVSLLNEVDFTKNLDVVTKKLGSPELKQSAKRIEISLEPINNPKWVIEQVELTTCSLLSEDAFESSEFVFIRRIQHIADLLHYDDGAHVMEFAQLGGIEACVQAIEVLGVKKLKGRDRLIMELVDDLDLLSRVTSLDGKITARAFDKIMETVARRPGEVDFQTQALRLANFVLKEDSSKSDGIHGAVSKVFSEESSSSELALAAATAYAHIDEDQVSNYKEVKAITLQAESIVLKNLDAKIVDSELAFHSLKAMTAFSSRKQAATPLFQVDAVRSVKATMKQYPGDARVQALAIESLANFRLRGEQEVEETIELTQEVISVVQRLPGEITVSVQAFELAGILAETSVVSRRALLESNVGQALKTVMVQNPGRPEIQGVGARVEELLAPKNNMEWVLEQMEVAIKNLDQPDGSVDLLVAVEMISRFPRRQSIQSDIIASAKQLLFSAMDAVVKRPGLDQRAVLIEGILASIALLADEEEILEKLTPEILAILLKAAGPSSSLGPELLSSWLTNVLVGDSLSDSTSLADIVRIATANPGNVNIQRNMIALLRRMAAIDPEAVYKALLDGNADVTLCNAIRLSSEDPEFLVDVLDAISGFAGSEVLVSRLRKRKIVPLLLYSLSKFEMSAHVTESGFACLASLLVDQPGGDMMTASPTLVQYHKVMAANAGSEVLQLAATKLVSKLCDIPQYRTQLLDTKVDRHVRTAVSTHTRSAELQAVAEQTLLLLGAEYNPEWYLEALDEHFIDYNEGLSQDELKTAAIELIDVLGSLTGIEKADGFKLRAIDALVRQLNHVHAVESPTHQQVKFSTLAALNGIIKGGVDFANMVTLDGFVATFESAEAQMADEASVNITLLACPQVSATYGPKLLARIPGIVPRLLKLAGSVTTSDILERNLWASIASLLMVNPEEVATEFMAGEGHLSLIESLTKSINDQNSLIEALCCLSVLLSTHGCVEACRSIPLIPLLSRIVLMYPLDEKIQGPALECLSYLLSGTPVNAELSEAIIHALTTFPHRKRVLCACSEVFASVCPDEGWRSSFLDLQVVATLDSTLARISYDKTHVKLNEIKDMFKVALNVSWYVRYWRSLTPTISKDSPEAVIQELYSAVEVLKSLTINVDVVQALQAVPELDDFLFDMVVVASMFSEVSFARMAFSTLLAIYGAEQLRRAVSPASMEALYPTLYGNVEPEYIIDVLSLMPDAIPVDFMRSKAVKCCVSTLSQFITNTKVVVASANGLKVLAVHDAKAFRVKFAESSGCELLVGHIKRLQNDTESHDALVALLALFGHVLGDYHYDRTLLDDGIMALLLQFLNSYSSDREMLIPTLLCMHSIMIAVPGHLLEPIAEQVAEPALKVVEAFSGDEEVAIRALAVLAAMSGFRSLLEKFGIIDAITSHMLEWRECPAVVNAASRLLELVTLAEIEEWLDPILTYEDLVEAAQNGVFDIALNILLRHTGTGGRAQSLALDAIMGVLSLAGDDLLKLKGLSALIKIFNVIFNDPVSIMHQPLPLISSMFARYTTLVSHAKIRRRVEKKFYLVTLLQLVPVFATACLVEEKEDAALLGFSETLSVLAMFSDSDELAKLVVGDEMMYVLVQRIVPAEDSTLEELLLGVLRFISICCKYDSLRRELGSAGGIDAMTNLLFHYEDTESPVLTGVLMALAAATFDDLVNCDALLNDDDTVLECIIAILANHISSTQLVYATTSLLINLCYGNDLISETAVNLGVTEALSDTLLRNLGKPDVLSSTLSLLGTLSYYPSNTPIMVADGACRGIVPVLVTFLEDEKITKKCVEVLVNLTDCGVEGSHAQTTMGDSGVVRALIEVILFHEKLPEICMFATQSLFHLAKDTENCRNSILGGASLGVGKALINTPDHDGLVSAAAWLLYCWCCSTDIHVWRLVKGLHLIEGLSGVLLTHKTDPDSIQVILKCLSRMAFDHRAASLMGRRGIVEALASEGPRFLKLTDADGMESPLVLMSLITLHYFSQSERVVSTFADPILKYLKKVFRHCRSIDALETGLVLLETLALLHSNIPVIIKSDVCESLIKLLRETEPEQGDEIRVMLRGLQCITRIARYGDSDAKRRLQQYDAVIMTDEVFKDIRQDDEIRDAAKTCRKAILDRKGLLAKGGFGQQVRKLFNEERNDYLVDGVLRTDIKNKLIAGNTFLKYSERTKPRRSLVQVNAALSRLSWQDPKSKDTRLEVAVNALTDVRKGRCTPALKKKTALTRKFVADENASFAIFHGAKALSFEASNSEERDEWYMAFSALIAANKKFVEDNPAGADATAVMRAVHAAAEKDYGEFNTEFDYQEEDDGFITAIEWQQPVLLDKHNIRPNKEFLRPSGRPASTSDAADNPDDQAYIGIVEENRDEERNLIAGLMNVVGASSDRVVRRRSASRRNEYSNAPHRIEHKSTRSKVRVVNNPVRASVHENADDWAYMIQNDMI